MRFTARLRDWPIRWKLVVFLMCSSTLPLALAAVMQLRSTREKSEAAALSLLRARADQAIAELDGFHRRYLRSVAQVATLKEARLLVEASPHDRAGEVALVRTILEAHGEAEPEIHHAVVLDARGAVVAGHGGGLSGIPRSFLDEASRGLSSVSGVFLAPHEEGAAPLIAYAARIRRADGSTAGLAVLFARASAFWDAVRHTDGLAGKGSFSILLDQNGVRMGHSFAQDLVFRPIQALDTATIETMVAERRFGAKTRDLIEQPVILGGRLADIPLQALGEGQHVRVWAPGNQRWNLTVSRKLQAVPWTILYLVPEDSLREPALVLLASSTLPALALLLVAFVLGSFFADRAFLRPIRALSTAASQYGAGNLDARVTARTFDELGELGHTFNDMAAALADVRRGLEQKVTERTEALHRANVELAEQNRALAETNEEIEHRQARSSAYGRALAVLAGPDSLADVIASALREVAGYLDAVVISCYAIEGGVRLVPVAGFGAGAQARLGTSELPGLAKEALAMRRPVWVEPVPEDVELRFDAVIVGGRPRSVGLLPLVVGEREVGILAIGTLVRLPAEAEGLLSDLAVPLALTILRHELSAQRDRYADDLARQNEELQAQAEELQAQREELIAQQRELEQKNREVEEANRLKTEFVANMSHELRTPLNTVIGFTELLLEDLASQLAPTHRHYLEDIRGSGRHLLALINQVLDLAKIEAGRISLSMSAVTPAHLIMGARVVVEGAASRRGITFAERVETDAVVRADEDKLRQVLINLLSNAVKFSPQGSAVEVGAREDGSLVRFWVKDHGPGITAAFMPRLFEPFVQGEDPLIKKHEGTGLGLAISKRLIEEHGGTIEAFSEEGSGALFSFTVPKWVDAEGSPSLSRRVEGNAQQLPVQAARASGSGHVLVMDADPSACRLLCGVLEPLGYRLSTAGSAATGLAIAKRESPAVIVLDLALPDMSGFQLVEALASEVPGSSLLVLTAQSLSPEERSRLKTRAAAVAQKGDLTPEDLIATINRVTRNRAGATTNGKSTLILVVDDHDLNRELCRTLLERRGYQVLVAEDGEAAVEAARRNSPDLVLLDLAMPRKDGFAARRELALDPTTSAIPVVALTARAMRSDEQRAIAEGFAACVSKPVDADHLERTISGLLASPHYSPGLVARSQPVVADRGDARSEGGDSTG
ncbi:MAG: response regulator, partial [Deltaproteobacteria bacterium]|nr:response regulator [Deltaproteobacteria bacterium]